MYTFALNYAEEGDEIYRIFYYDCMPLTKKVSNPVDGRTIDLSKSDSAKFRITFFESLRKKRKVALRLGTLTGGKEWIINSLKTKDLIKKKITLSDLTTNDVKLEIRQKGVDMKIGVDIASLAFKRQVDRIVLVAGDSDFVPAAKLARREGIDFILAPMWNNIQEDLHEHIDGLESRCPRYRGDGFWKKRVK